MMAFYLQIPKIKGSATHEKHKGWIKLDSLDLCNNRPMHVNLGSGADRDYSRPQISDVTLVKELDASSPYLYQNSFEGKSLDKVIIHACNVSKGNHVYLEYTLYDAMISYYDICGSSANDQDDLRETIKINFTKIQMKYISQDASGRPGTPTVTGFDIRAATKL
jgi:type VI secretion system secreted protein Hcp